MAKNRKTPDMNLPVWFDGQNINEALFCEEFLHERRIIFANGAFFTPDGRVTDDLPLRGEIYDKLKFCAVNNIPRKITNILEVLKLEAQVPDFPPEQDRIHVFNGTLLLNGTFTEGRPAIVRSRLPVVYNPDAPAPVIWLNFLNGLLHAEDIPTLQEFIGYCLIPSNKGQRMMVIKGNGGEGKSQIGAVLSAIFGTNIENLFINLEPSPDCHFSRCQSMPADVKSWTTFFTNKFEKKQKNKPYKAFSRYRTALSLVGLNCYSI